MNDDPLPRPALPRAIWILGFVSLLMDISSELIHSLLPLFMATTLAAGPLLIGIVEGLAEATALIVKVFSGVLSDYLGKRKALAVWGYALGALAKPLFALATGIGTVLGARLIDRVGKGIRGAPRDALIADLAPQEVRGAAFGLRQSLDTVGSFLGPMLGIALMLAWHNDFRAVFWVAVVPAALSVVLLQFGVQEPALSTPGRRPEAPHMASLRHFNRRYWWVVAIGATFTLARFSEAFLLLRALQGGVPVAFAPIVLIGMNVVYSLSAYPLGRLSDTVRHTRLLALGMVLLIAADLVLAWRADAIGLAVGVALWGLHMGATQGLLARMVADSAPAPLRGSAFGFFNLASGIALLMASVLAGGLWERFGAAVTFATGAALALLALALLGARPRAVPDAA